MGKFDMHCHISEGSVDSHLSLTENIEILKSKGYSGLLITDHDTYKGWRYYEEELRGRADDGFVVLRGIEYDTRDGGHIIVVMPTEYSIPKLFEIKGMKLSELTELVHRHGGILGPAHPYGEAFMSFMHSKAGRHNVFIADQFDFIETFNACEYARCNNAAGIFARELDKPVFGGSDSHRKGAAGMGWTLIDADIRTEDDLIHAVLNNKRAFKAGGDYYHYTTKERIGKPYVIMSYGFGAYLKAASLVRSPSRKSAFKSLGYYTDIAKHGRYYTVVSSKMNK